MSDKPTPGGLPTGATFGTTAMISGGAHIHRRISWAAIFGGVTLVVVVQLLLSTLGVGVGLGTINVNAGTSPDAGNFGLAAGAWWVISSCIALSFGGYAAAWLAGIEIRFDGVLHGLVTWGLATLLTVYLLTSAIGGSLAAAFPRLAASPQPPEVESPTWQTPCTVSGHNP